MFQRFLFLGCLQLLLGRQTIIHPQLLYIIIPVATTIEHDGCSAQGCALIAYTIASIYLSICTHSHSVKSMSRDDRQTCLLAWMMNSIIIDFTLLLASTSYSYVLCVLYCLLAWMMNSIIIDLHLFQLASATLTYSMCSLLSS